MNSKSLFLLSLVFITGCNAIPDAYNGNFAGTISGQNVELGVSSDQISVSINGKSQTLKNFVSGFNGALTAVQNAQAGVYTLPTVVSFEGIPVSSPWVMREDMSTIGYHDSTQNSDHLVDVYAVIENNPQTPNGAPFDFGGLTPFPINGSVGDFYATVLYAQVDTKVSSAVSKLDVQIAPLAHLGAVNVDVMGAATIKMLSIAPEADSHGNEVILQGTLARKP